jgi:hypothetical protein
MASAALPIHTDEAIANKDITEQRPCVIVESLALLEVHGLGTSFEEADERVLVGGYAVGQHETIELRSLGGAIASSTSGDEAGPREDAELESVLQGGSQNLKGLVDGTMLGEGKHEEIAQEAMRREVGADGGADMEDTSSAAAASREEGDVRSG